MRWLVAGLLSVHGLIHLMGFAKAFGYAVLPQLTTPISRPRGLLWLGAGGLVLATALMVATGARQAWIAAILALAVSQSVILSAWRDAWAGTAANLLLLFVAAYGWLTQGPLSFQAQFRAEAAAVVARTADAPVIGERDLAPLPEPVRRYLRLAGVVGRPHVRNYRITFRGRIRSAPDAPWMAFTAEQQSLADPPARHFLMHARMRGLPVEALHRSVGGRATMKVVLAGVVPLVDAAGEVMDRSEDVTLFNDMCLLAPATLVDPRIAWAPVDERTVRARFTNGARTIAATLRFREDGLLETFESEDRARASADGRTFTRHRFSTPVRDYRDYGVVRIASHGDARWLLPDGEFTYGEFDIVDVAYNVRPAGAGREP